MPFLMRVVSGLKSKVKYLQFSDDSYSQIMAILEDGNVKLFLINQSGPKSLDKWVYATSKQLSQK